jgi:hypothetical protein
MAIYLHEASTIDRGGKEGYLEALRTGWVPYAEESRGLRLVWAGSTIGSTASWPETMALWELRDWDHFADVCQRMYTEHTDDARLAEWWRGSFRFRTRAHSQVLIGTRFSPTLDELLANDVAGTAYAFTRYGVAPGKLDAFLGALERRVELDAALGRRLVGAYEVAFTNDAAYAIWAFPGLVEAGAYQEAVARDAGVRDWERSVEPLLARGSVEVWGFATPWCPLWPKGYRTETRIW